MQKVFLAIPSSDGRICITTMLNVMDFINQASVAKLGVQISTWSGDSIVSQARNVLVGRFLASDCTDMLFIDSDVGWESGALMRLLKYDVDCVAALYPFKMDQIKFGVKYIDPNRVEQRDDGLIEVALIPMGITRLRRSLVEAVRDRFAHTAYRRPDVNEQLWALFDHEVVNGEYWGEDFLFCKRARECGFNIYVDPDIRTSHTGSKQWVGKFGDLLERYALEDLIEKTAA